MDLSGDKYNSCSHLYLIFTHLINHLEEQAKNNKYSHLKKTIESMSLKLNEYWVFIKPIALICHILDPRFKTDFLEKDDKKQGVKLIQELIKAYKQKYSDDEETQDNESTNSSKKGLLLFFSGI